MSIQPPVISEEAQKAINKKLERAEAKLRKTHGIPEGKAYSPASPPPKPKE